MKKTKRFRIVATAAALITVVLGVLILSGVFDSFGPGGWFSSKKPDWVSVTYEPHQLRVFSVEEENVGEPDITVNETLFLISNEYPVSEDREFSLECYKTTDVLMNKAMIDDYARLSAAVTEETGDKLYVMSSYRSFDDQRALFEEDPDIAAKPGASEHHSGLALDVYVYMFAGEGFIRSEAGRFVNEKCHEYGFIIRYPRGKERITGFSYEPWHIRYVGQPHARIIALSNLTLEEYIDKLGEGDFYAYDGWIISRQVGPEIYIPQNATEITISEDNTGFYVITAKTA
ncbi:MAG: M15 family metallopeptidase [Clostridiales bacterium]|nr:M15 family metallopeptidase [Clostridiales bacterium]